MASSISATSLLPCLPTPKLQLFHQLNQNPAFKIGFCQPRCTLSLSTDARPPPQELSKTKPSPAEISRTLMELSSCGTLSTTNHDGWPLGVGAQFVVDAEGKPALCLNQPERLFAVDAKSSFHVRFQQSGSRTPQCTLLGTLKKPYDEYNLKKLCSRWEKKYSEAVDQNLLYVVSVERVLQMEDFKEDGVWVTSTEYVNAEPDPLRNFAEKIVDEMNSRHTDEVERLCNVYIDTGFQVTDAKIIWVDRLGFDFHIHSEQGVYAARIPFPREVYDEKGVKSSFNSMSHLAWEIEKNYMAPDFEKVKCLKKVR